MSQTNWVNYVKVAAFILMGLAAGTYMFNEFTKKEPVTLESAWQAEQDAKTHKYGSINEAKKELDVLLARQKRAYSALYKNSSLFQMFYYNELEHEGKDPSASMDVEFERHNTEQRLIVEGNDPEIIAYKKQLQEEAETNLIKGKSYLTELDINMAVLEKTVLKLERLNKSIERLNKSHGYTEERLKSMKRSE